MYTKFFTGDMEKLYKFIFFVPATHTEAVKQAVFGSGAGQIGNYDHCSFQVRGQGQFKPLKGSNPHIGNQDTLEHVEEDRVEVLVRAQHLDAAIAALKKAHPYETPAWEAVALSRPTFNEI
eukprot:Protomagalhaensia_wolfi_Nauph_80__3219@NODE_327_length_2778_cov_148_512596_g246_i0_p3_GENE_NODE_327_length_2778_cov_148_512596_g246_i0NODE_327_length_2778_cov_148_512596_g246_i0_p3_ORF_typecomplete_len121_score26_31CutA1/PF03091_15/0_00081PII/PF00543_22/0_0048Hce2/PF14856_6/0_059_NODE_327_length_2778_cov_148_512596_g246_i012151577